MKINKVLIHKDKRLSLLKEQLQPVSAQYYTGDEFLSLLNSPMVSIAGSRKIKPYRCTITTQLVGGLSRAGAVIVSCLALGVDSTAHNAALDVGGKTIAVITCGLNRMYPACIEI
jgi:DNA processing protein